MFNEVNVFFWKLKTQSGEGGGRIIKALTAQGSVLSPTPFSVPVGYIFTNIPFEFTDDAAFGKEVQKYIAKRMQQGINKVVGRGIKWGLNFYLKRETMFFTRRTIGFKHV